MKRLKLSLKTQKSSSRIEVKEDVSLATSFNSQPRYKVSSSSRHSRGTVTVVRTHVHTNTTSDNEPPLMAVDDCSSVGPTSIGSCCETESTSSCECSDMGIVDGSNQRGTEICLLKAENEYVSESNCVELCRTLPPDLPQKDTQDSLSVNQIRKQVCDDVGVLQLHQVTGRAVSTKRQMSLLSFLQKKPSNSHRNPQTSSSSSRKSSMSFIPPPPKAPNAGLFHDAKPQRYNSDRVTPQSRKRSCPFYKKVPGTAFTVDAFSYGTISNCTSYFLSHFHSDHYMGLSRRFQHPVYCSMVTANLIKQQLKVSPEYVKALEMNKPYVIDGVEVIFLDANHCPGSVMILFKLCSGKNYLHTGDFRFRDDMLQCHRLSSLPLTQLFLDTTYCNPAYDFPKQDDVIAFVVDKVLTTLGCHPNTLIVCGTYTIGKEKVFMAIAETLDLKVCVYKGKKAILDCLEDPGISRAAVTDTSSSNLHVLPIGELTLERLGTYLEQHQTKYTSLLAFKPTGWTHQRKNVSTWPKIQPQCHGAVTVYGVPYSEHSSFSELRQFVQFLKPQKIIPTVNNYSASKREEMQRIFGQWLSTSGSPIKLKQSTLHAAFTVS